MTSGLSRRALLRLGVVGGAAAATGLLAACGGSGGPAQPAPTLAAKAPDAKPSPSAPAADGERLTFVWSPKAVNNPVFDVARIGGVDKARELGITVFWIGPETADAQKQVQLLDDVITRGTTGDPRLSGIGVSCNDPDALKGVIDRAVDAGIPVITWDSDSPESKRSTFYSLDNRKAAQEAARIFMDVTKDSPNKTYAILTGVPGAHNLEERIAAFREVVDPRGYRWVATDPCFDEIQRGVEVVENRMTANPDLGGWFMAGAWPLFGDINAMPKLLAAKGKTKIVAWDILESELKLLKEGVVQGLIGQKFYGWGYDAVEILYNIVTKKQQYPPFVDSGMDIVTTPEQADVFLNKWSTKNWK
jgi:ribose transport system substrate-binding protein